MRLVERMGDLAGKLPSSPQDRVKCDLHKIKVLGHFRLVSRILGRTRAIPDGPGVLDDAEEGEPT
jgi:hypothetical protein